jgi:hypothetical protein
MPEDRANRPGYSATSFGRLQRSRLAGFEPCGYWFLHNRQSQERSSASAAYVCDVGQESCGGGVTHFGLAIEPTFDGKERHAIH